VRHYTKHHLTSNDNSILSQFGWQVQPQSNTGNTLNLAWALGLNGLVGPFVTISYLTLEDDKYLLPYKPDL
jgi:hypothetical protein